MSIVHAISTVHAKGAAAAGDVVTLSGTTVSANWAYDFDVGVATAGWYFRADGTVDEHEFGSITQFQSSTQWVIPNAYAGDFWIRFSNYSGSNPNSGYTGGTWLALTTNRQIIWTTSITIRVGVQKVEIATDSGGSNIVATGYYGGDVEVDSCPFCCFTPDTLITMADGTLKPVCDVEKGDIICTRTGTAQVTGIITRVRRRMHKVSFTRSRSLNMSDDHPIYIVGKGYSAINPLAPYKDMGMAKRLAVGDQVVRSDGSLDRIESIESIDYPHTVYTLENSEFYANGMLVY